MLVPQLGYHIVELRLLTCDRGEVGLSLLCGEPDSGPVGPEGRKTQRWPVDVSSLGAVRILLHDHVGVTNVGYCTVAYE